MAPSSYDVPEEVVEDTDRLREGAAPEVHADCFFSPLSQGMAERCFFSLTRALPRWLMRFFSSADNSAMVFLHRGR